MEEARIRSNVLVRRSSHDVTPKAEGTTVQWVALIVLALCPIGGYMSYDAPGALSIFYSMFQREWGTGRRGERKQGRKRGESRRGRAPHIILANDLGLTLTQIGGLYTGIQISHHLSSYHIIYTLFIFFSSAYAVPCVLLSPFCGTLAYHFGSHRYTFIPLFSLSFLFSSLSLSPSYLFMLVGWW